MRIANALLAVIFFVFAFVQINDPDPLYWMLIYGVMIGFSVLAFTGRFYPRTMLLIIGAYGFAAFHLSPAFMEWINSDDRALLFDDFAKMQFPYIEETREFVGLLICLSALIFFYVQAHRNNSGAESDHIG